MTLFSPTLMSFKIPTFIFTPHCFVYIFTHNTLPNGKGVVNNAYLLELIHVYKYKFKKIYFEFMHTFSFTHSRSPTPQNFLPAKSQKAPAACGSIWYLRLTIYSRDSFLGFTIVL